MAFDWPYYDLRSDGYLYTRVRKDRYVKAFPTTQTRAFENAAEAEEWLREKDIRGNVR
jgi:hypothetical protein